MAVKNTAQERSGPFDWLFARITKVDSRADGTCHPSLRRLIIKILEMCVCDDDFLSVYSWGLKRMFGTTPRYERVLTIEDVAKVCESGLDNLDSEKLIHLSLCLTDLWAIYHLITHKDQFRQYRYWMKPMQKVKMAKLQACVGDCDVVTQNVSELQWTVVSSPRSGGWT